MFYDLIIYFDLITFNTYHILLGYSILIAITILLGYIILIAITILLGYIILIAITILCIEIS